MTRGSKVQVQCLRCRAEFTARVADRKRGWAKFCSKSCKASEQENRTGQFAAHEALQQAHEAGSPIAFVDRHNRYVGFSGHDFDNTMHQDKD